jgi:hypothetical protein
MVWIPGKVSEEPVKVMEVWVSQEGAACLIYSTSMWVTPVTSFDPLGHGGGWKRMRDAHGNWAVFDRCMLIPATALAACSGSSESVPSLPAAVATQFVLPRNVRTDSYDEAAVRAAIAGWQALPILDGSNDEEENTLRRARQEGMAAFVYSRREVEGGLSVEAWRLRTHELPPAVSHHLGPWDRKVEIPTSSTRVAVVIPARRAGFKWWTYPLRVVATPPAVVADIVILPVYLVVGIGGMAVTSLID